MNNGWRDGILVVWLVSLLVSIALWVSMAVIISKGASGVDLLPLVPILEQAAEAVTAGWFGSLLLWLAVSAVVKEHHKDRQQAARER
ncbi:MULTISPECIES: hypothetical protein [Curtobacterium]|uniref:Uncharacterized protein n=1 Tax=Curtobacterium citreum TaxID=2036 RepID=A0ABU8YB59_9MICO|nr:hypothetical protein [Curtobacterium sp. TC1]QZQ54769.1 hypothetical protein KZI27_15990 [Curtobacterium sp. TC1]